MRGHGESDSPPEPTATEAESVADMAGILDACGYDRAIIGGLSLGGYLSLAFHLAHPGRTAALMLIDTGPGYKNDEARQKWNESVSGWRPPSKAAASSLPGQPRTPGWPPQPVRSGPGGTRRP